MFSSRVIHRVPVQRAFIPRPPVAATRLLTTSRPSTYPASSGHSADSYFKDVDAEPPLDPTVHRVDSASDAVQRPYEPPSGQYSQAGVKTEEYRTMDKAEPYDAPGNGHEGEKLRYGGKEKYSVENKVETSDASEGPDRKSAGGRKPEGK